MVSITEQADDTPTGKLLEAIIEGVDEFYSENLAQEVTRGMREAASRGFWMTTYAPYGYKRVHVQDGAAKRPKLELNPPADAVVRRVFDMVLQGRSVLDVTKTLNAEASQPPTARSGSRPPSTPCSPTKPTPALWSGEPKPRTELPPCESRTHTPPSSPSGTSRRPGGCSAPASPRR